MIAMALACEPQVLIADEPTTALDVTIQAQILELLKSLVAERNTALIMITHDLGVVAGMCERVNVMYAGTFVETGSALQVFAAPRHPYTLGLLESVPRLDSHRKQRLTPIEGAPRDMLSPPTSCPFAPRCRYEVEESRERLPPLEEVEPGPSRRLLQPGPRRRVAPLARGPGRVTLPAMSSGAEAQRPHPGWGPLVVHPPPASSISTKLQQVCNTL